MILDNKIYWKPQIKYVRGKLAWSIACPGKNKAYPEPESSLYIILLPLLLAHFSYCVEVWEKTYKSIYKKKLFTEEEEKLRKKKLL